MEIEIHLFERTLKVNGEVQDCICKGEKWYGDPMPELGNHMGCGNLVRLILIANDWEITKEVTIQKIVILPEVAKGLWHEKEMTTDKTMIEFWSDKKELEIPWNKVREITNLLKKYQGKVEEIDWRKYWIEGGGKACRGFDLKYIPQKMVKLVELDEETRTRIQKFVDDLPYDQVKAEWDRKQETPERTIMVEMNGKIPPIPQSKFAIPPKSTVLPRAASGEASETVTVPSETSE